MTGQTGQRQTVLRRGCAATEQADGTCNLFESNVKLLLSSKNYLSFAQWWSGVPSVLSALSCFRDTVNRRLHRAFEPFLTADRTIFGGVTINCTRLHRTAPGQKWLIVLLRRLLRV